MAFPSDPPWGTEWIDASARERGAAFADLAGLADALPQGLRSDGSPSLVEKILTVDRALAGIPHAIGGAIALVYYGEPRMTIDIDVNMLVSIERWPEIKQALTPLAIEVELEERELSRDREARLLWDRNPIHLLFSADALHEVMPTAIRRVPLVDSTIPIVSPEHLVIGKATLNRPIDWLDIEAILVATEPMDLEEIRHWLGRLAPARLAMFETLAIAK